MKKTRILFITRAYGERAGGMERLSYEFIAAAKQHPGFEISVLAHQTPPNLPLWRVRLQATLFTIVVIPKALLAARSADIIHVGDPVLAFAGYLIKKIWQKPIIVTVHGLDVTYSQMLYQLYLRLFFRAFDAYLPISTDARGLLEHHHVRGHIQVLTPGVRDRYYDPSIKRDASSKVLLTVGRLVPRKGHAWFIQNILPQLPENVTYLIAGSGPSLLDINRTIEEARQGGRVRLLGRVNEETLRTLYNTADIFIQPNIPVPGDREGFGLVLLEAALCNRPVIASRLEGIPDAIHNGKNGWLVSPGDVDNWIAAIMQVLSGKAHLPNARDYTLRTFSMAKMIDNYRVIIENLLIGRR